MPDAQPVAGMLPTRQRELSNEISCYLRKPCLAWVLLARWKVQSSLPGYLGTGGLLGGRHRKCPLSGFFDSNWHALNGVASGHYRAGQGRMSYSVESVAYHAVWWRCGDR